MLDLTKPVQTRCGHKARILCTDRIGNKWPVIALVEDEAGKETVISYPLSGRFGASENNPYDLVNVKPLQLEVGKMYKTRGNKKVFLYFYDSDEEVFLGVVEGKYEKVVYQNTGRVLICRFESILDITEEVK